ncbi:hypothetical protein DAPPUDRAFT_244240 [Daphnia pulex]|uniref:Uncharacterized protein n=1 Tax=Daphnia pulex TaxID=6669 RepID=E9GKI3_DAPPU|nr:hypothetical protein DAPPUDRAFT_244240 [Daphnia pulex]|eukprot:EFX79998.1 hypothetical protein DAPPUDRAFT_244240 [Daphnia pulex]
MSRFHDTCKGKTSVRLCISANKACGYNKSFDLEFEEDWVLEETEAVSVEVNNDAVEYKLQPTELY